MASSTTCLLLNAAQTTCRGVRHTLTSRPCHRVVHRMVMCRGLSTSNPLNRKPYTELPKKFNHRFQTSRDDVYFLSEQVGAQHKIEDAFDVIRSYALFDAEPIKVDITINMGSSVDKESGKEMRDEVRGDVILTRRVSDPKILVLAEGEEAEGAKGLYPSVIVGGFELFGDIQEYKLDFDYVLTTPSFYPNLLSSEEHIGLDKVLGKKMPPHEKHPSVTKDLVAMVERYSKYTKLVETEENRIVMTIGFTDFTREEMMGNLRSLIKTIHKLKQKKEKTDIFFRQGALSGQTVHRLDLSLEDICRNAEG